jgi:L-threonylcarbamoyladenylate synthase
MITDAEIAEAVAHLRGGGVVIYPTGSFLAAGVLATLPEAVGRLRTLKGRPSDKPFGVIVATIDAVTELGIDMGANERDLAVRFWPGPLSLVLPLAAISPLAASFPGGTVAVRVPGHPVAHALAAACGGAITATSANRSGAPPVTTARDLGPEWRSPDVLILGDEPAAGGLPSTLVAVRDGVARVLRPGRISTAELGAAS